MRVRPRKVASRSHDVEVEYKIEIMCSSHAYTDLLGPSAGYIAFQYPGLIYQYLKCGPSVPRTATIRCKLIRWIRLNAYRRDEYCPMSS